MKNLSTAKALPGKTDRSRYRPVHGTELHKGFYCDNNNFANLKEIEYEGHLPLIDDDEEHLTSAGCLLEGSCQAFAMQVEEILGYEAFITKKCNRKGHHVFCQATLEGKIALIDARGVTTNYDEFIHKRPPGTLFDDNPSGRAFVRAPERPGYGAWRASQGWRVESEAHGANVNDPVRLERMEIVNDLCSRLKRCLWRYLGISPRNTPAHPDWRIGLFRVQQACGRWGPTARVVRHIPMTDATYHSLGQALHHPLSKLHNLILNVFS